MRHTAKSAHAVLAQELRFGLIHEQSADPRLAAFVEKLEAAVPKDAPWLRLEKAPPWHQDSALIRTLPAGAAVHSIAVLPGPDDLEERREWLLAAGYAASEIPAMLREYEKRRYWVLLGLENGTLLVFDDTLGQAVGQPLEGHSNTVSAVAFSGDGRRALSGSADQTLRVWNLERFECERILKGGLVIAVALSGDGRRALSGSIDRTMRVWNLERFECERILEGHSDKVSAVALSGDGRRAISGSSDETMRVWNLERFECEKIMKGDSSVLTGVALSGDGRRAVSGGSWYGTVLVWNLESFECELILRGHSDDVNAVVLSGDGRRALSGSRDHSVRVWNLERFECEKVFEGHSHSASAVTLNGDGRRALSGSWDHTVRVWNLERFECARILEGHSHSVSAVAFSGDGQQALSGSGDGTVWIWKLTDGKCLGVFECPGPILDVLWHPHDPVRFTAACVVGSLGTYRPVPFHLELRGVAGEP